MDGSLMHRFDLLADREERRRCDLANALDACRHVGVDPVAALLTAISESLETTDAEIDAREAQGQ